MNIWKILGIEPTTDIKVIKKAYARLAAEVHPEEHPQEFQELHTAYQQALQYAKRAKRFASEYDESYATEQLEQDADSQESERVSDALSTDDADVQPEKINEQHEEFLKHIYSCDYEDEALVYQNVSVAIEGVSELYYRRAGYNEWYEFFKTPPANAVCTEKLFIDGLLNFLKSNAVDMNMINALFEAYSLYKFDGVEGSVYSELYKFVFACRVKNNSPSDSKLKAYNRIYSTDAPSKGKRKGFVRFTPTAELHGWKKAKRILTKIFLSVFISAVYIVAAALIYGEEENSTGAFMLWMLIVFWIDYFFFKIFYLLQRRINNLAVKIIVFVLFLLVPILMIIASANLLRNEVSRNLLTLSLYSQFSAIIIYSFFIFVKRADG